MLLVNTWKGFHETYVNRTAFLLFKSLLSLMTVLDCVILMGFLSLIIVSVQESFIGNVEIYFYYFACFWARNEFL